MSSRKLLKLKWTPESIPTAWGLKTKSASHEIVTEMIGDLVKVNESLDYKHVTYEKIKKNFKKNEFSEDKGKRFNINLGI